MDTATTPIKQYQPGVCNIGPAEIQKRKETAILSALFATGYSFVGYAFQIPILFKLFVFLPALIASVGFVQVYFHFCVAFGLSNVFNFGNEVGKTNSVLENQAIELDKAQAWKLIGISTAIAFVYTMISIFLS